MKHSEEIILNGNKFTIKYYDDSRTVQEFTPYKMQAPKKYNGLIEVFFSPIGKMSEAECVTVFKESNDELLTYIFDIINRFPKLYKNLNIERKFNNFEISFAEYHGIRYVNKVRRELEILLKEEAVS